MMRSVIPLMISLGSLAAAINITSPAANTTYAAGSTVTVKWTSVDTDPINFSLYLWNFVSWPPTYVPLALDIPTADLSHSVQIPCDTNPEWGYQISGINGTNVYIIYAQGDKFTISEPVDGTDCVDPAPEPTPSTCPSAAVSTVYVTVSPTGSSSRLFHPSSHVSSPSPSTTATSKSVKPGIVPKTIDYSHPVTLDKVPTPTPAPMVTPAPGQDTGARGRRVKTITTTVSIEACPIDAI
ncbi:LOW QUALITY PROTEIN: serine/threonine-rich protein adg2 [Aspergillus udagawae]|uniref:Serine/threonine-rich protein adg2 n=1 Tax=Aspergillus udagawae TaxID=91492 RepID=A0A8H3PDU8_9EURO|nr:LOW QUALITY PROTEIN: serine/threonine-rich protein adg2 [Aspergillus udagawae]